MHWLPVKRNEYETEQDDYVGSDPIWNPINTFKRRDT